MRIQRDQRYDLLYIELHDGEVEETHDLAEGVYADVDIEGRVLGGRVFVYKGLRQLHRVGWR